MATQHTTIINATDSGYRLGSNAMKKEHSSYPGYVSCGYHSGDEYYAYAHFKFNTTQFATIPNNAKIISATFRSPSTANMTDEDKTRTMYAGHIKEWWSGSGGGKPARAAGLTSTNTDWRGYGEKLLNVKEIVEDWLSGLYSPSLGLYITAYLPQYSEYAYYIISKNATITIVWQEGGSLVYVGKEDGTTVPHNVYIWDEATSAFKMCYLYYADSSGAFIQT